MNRTPKLLRPLQSLTKPVLPFAVGKKSNMDKQKIEGSGFLPLTPRRTALGANARAASLRLWCGRTTPAATWPGPRIDRGEETLGLSVEVFDLRGVLFLLRWVGNDPGCCKKVCTLLGQWELLSHKSLVDEQRGVLEVPALVWMYCWGFIKRSSTYLDPQDSNPGSGSFRVRKY